MADFSMRVNGSEKKISVSPETPLLWVLRDTLELTGTKFGCGAGFCGACTVHVEGEAIRSCSTPVSQVNGKNVTTIEGLSANGLHVLTCAGAGPMNGFARPFTGHPGQWRPRQVQDEFSEPAGIRCGWSSRGSGARGRLLPSSLTHWHQQRLFFA